MRGRTVAFGDGLFRRTWFLWSLFQCASRCNVVMRDLFVFLSGSCHRDCMLNMATGNLHCVVIFPLVWYCFGG